MNSGTDVKAIDYHYKAYVGQPAFYDLVGSMQFNLLTSFGLRDAHKLLDIGCGSLRSGKLLIPYLQAGNYYGIEPNQWLLDEGIEQELGRDILAIKKPTFNDSSDFELGVFDESFDYINAQSIFSHTSIAQTSKCLGAAREVLKPEGLFLATFMLGKENYQGDEWVYPGCVTFTPTFVAQMIEGQGLRCIRTQWAHPSFQTWYLIFHPDNQSRAKQLNAGVFRRHKDPLLAKLLRHVARSPVLNNPVTRSLYRMMGKPGASKS